MDESGTDQFGEEILADRGLVRGHVQAVLEVAKSPTLAEAEARLGEPFELPEWYEKHKGNEGEIIEIFPLIDRKFNSFLPSLIIDRYIKNFAKIGINMDTAKFKNDLKIFLTVRDNATKAIDKDKKAKLDVIALARKINGNVKRLLEFLEEYEEESARRLVREFLRLKGIHPEQPREMLEFLAFDDLEQIFADLEQYVAVFNKSHSDEQILTKDQDKEKRERQPAAGPEVWKMGVH